MILNPHISVVKNYLKSAQTDFEEWRREAVFCPKVDKKGEKETNEGKRESKIRW